MTRHTKTAYGIKVFILIWLGQLASLIGSQLTSFALGVWVYQQTGSVTQFALISVCAQLPGIVISPIAGALVDRFNRRLVMIFSDSGAGLGTLALVLLQSTGQLEVWHIYLITAFNSTFSAFQWPAYMASTSQLVPKQHLSRASGMVELGQAIARLISPVLGGVLLGLIQIQGVIIIDFATFLIALATLLIVRFPEVKTTTPKKIQAGSLLRESIYGWNYISARPGLLSLLFFFAAANFLSGVASILVSPLVLSFASAAVLGRILSIGGCGMLVGSLVMSTWGGPQQLIYAIYGFQLLQGLCLIAVGLDNSVALMSVAAFFFFFGLPIINGCSQAIWLRKVAADIQGRVFAVRTMIAFSSLPIAYFIAGPLGDFFEFLLSPKSPLAASVGQLIGVEPGRGIGLLFIVMGVLTIIGTVVAYQYPHLRLVEKELPDAMAID